MQAIRLDGTYTLSFESIGFHEASFDLDALAIEQYVSRAGLPIYRALITDRTMRDANRALCGIKSCQCGAEAALRIIESDGQGQWWIEIEPADLSSHNWDEIMPE